VRYENKKIPLNIINHHRTCILRNIGSDNTMRRQTPIGWQNVSPTRHRVGSRYMALHEIRERYPAAYELPVGDHVTYRVLSDNGSKVVALAWPDYNSPQWWYACMSLVAAEIGVSVCIFPLSDGQVRVYPGCFSEPPSMKPIRRPAMSGGETRINGWRLKRTRLRHGMTQVDLAKRIEQTTNSRSRYKLDTIEQLLSRFERGERIPFSDLFLRSAEKVLGDLGSETPPNIEILSRA
jgi:hypothetical protein